MELIFFLIKGTCVLNAEPRFLPHLLEIHGKFPKLRIVLEHVTTAAAVECVGDFLLYFSCDG
jgi:dihydroorotase